MTSPYMTTKKTSRDRRNRENDEIRKRTNVDVFVRDARPMTNKSDDPIDRKIARTKNPSKFNKSTLECEPSTNSTFASCYMEMCKQQNTRPLPIICVTLPHSLDLTTDRVKMDDWGPILNSLSIDRTLKSVSVRNRYNSRKPIDENRQIIDNKNKNIVSRKKHKEPILLTRYLIEWLSHSVSSCLTNSRSLNRLELEGVTFSCDCLNVLCVGLARTTCLRHLSLRRCCIGDEGCEIICRTIVNVGSLRFLDLSECDLSEKCAIALGSALSRQKLELYHETWKESLRYGEPNLEAMPGLRRLTLNGNHRFGDRAVLQLVDAVRDSLWLKALDLQCCGLTDAIGPEIINLLEHNKTLAILDVRMNANLSDDTVSRIRFKLENNGGNVENNGKFVYVWMSLNQNDRANAVSAGAIRRNRYENSSNYRLADNGSRMRPKSARIARGSAKNRELDGVKGTRDCGEVKNEVACPFNVGPTKMATLRERVVPKKSVTLRKSEITNSSNPNNNNNNNNENVKFSKTRQSKMAVCVDLRSAINEAIGPTTPTSEPPDRVNDEEESPTDGKFSKNPNESTTNPENDIHKILRELSKARMEQDRLLDETKRTNALLNEERLRRETVETKLRMAKENLQDLEKTLRNKERESRGLLLISQRSLDDIATSFDRLLEMIETSVTRRSIDRDNGRTDSTRYDDGDYAIAKTEIQTRVAGLIRKSKSAMDSRREFVVVDCENSNMNEGTSGSICDGNIVARKFARSAGDVTNAKVLSSSIVRPIRLERNIGDGRDVVSSLIRDNRLFRTNDANDSSDKRQNFGDDIFDGCTPCERARAIFARIVNGDGIFRSIDDRGS